MNRRCVPLLDGDRGPHCGAWYDDARRLCPHYSLDGGDTVGIPGDPAWSNELPAAGESESCSCGRRLDVIEAKLDTVLSAVEEARGGIATALAKLRGSKAARMFLGTD